ncbi:MAG TPA: hypothetical protein VGO52_21850 [Hyphomonadaceae bacterium]|jgi:hypothetical protein|nr:hypothetical protein [Hyphomonadaceae bacterium]
MSRLPFKIAYVAMVLGLATACAGAPKPDPVALAAAQSQCEALAVKYAQVVRDAGEATARYGSANSRRQELERLQYSLRNEMTRSGAPDVSRVAASALGAELASAKAERASLEARYGDDNSRTQTAAAGVYALEQAINAELSPNKRT